MADNTGEGSDEISPPRSTAAVRPTGEPTGARRDQSRLRGAARLQRYVWSRRARRWDQHASPALASVTSAVLGVAAVWPGAAVLDLGCGTGQIGIALASRGAAVLGVDVSPAMASELRARAERGGLSTLAVTTSPIEALALPAESFDLVVSSYALHHLRDADKARLVQAAWRWLRPGGRLVIADMMIGRGGSARDRDIIRSKVRTLASRGPGGWWRIAKNAVRYLLRVQERPISMAAWTGLLKAAGFTTVAATSIVAEAGLVTGQRPRAAARGPTVAKGDEAADEPATRPGRMPIGPRGLALLAATGVAGLVLAYHGWSGYHGQQTPSLAGDGRAAQPAGTPAASPTARKTTAGTTAPSPRGRARSPGPLLASQSYAQYAFQVWPGTPTARAKAALTGLAITVRQETTGLSVTAGVNGQPAGPDQLYRTGARVYVVEASLGDDSGTVDYNLGDDGIVVTDAGGRIVS